MQPFVKIARYGARFEITRYERPLVVGHAPSVYSRRRASDLTFKSQANIRRTQRRLRQNIGALAFTLGEPSFATFTYSDKKYDVVSAIQDWRDFTRRMARHFPSVAFVRVPERHKDGGVHFHAVIFGLDKELPCIMQKMRGRWIHACPQKRMCERKRRLLAGAWKKGFVDLQKARESEALGPYIAKYLTKNDPDWSLFGMHVATSNTNFRKEVQNAKTAGILFEMNSYKMPVSVDMIIDMMRDWISLRSKRRFETKWLGWGDQEIYRVET